MKFNQNSFRSILKTKTLHKTRQKFFSRLTALLLLGVTGIAQATPIIFYDGSIEYTSASQEINVTASVTNVDTSLVSTDVIGSTLSFTATLDSIIDNSPFTTATFDSNPSTVALVGSENWLTGSFDELEMSGLNDTNTGFLQGAIDIMSGTLLNDFASDASLFALELNLSNFISLNMFDTDFVGVLDGHIDATSVDASNPALLFILMSLAMLITVHRKQT